MAIRKIFLILSTLIFGVIAWKHWMFFSAIALIALVLYILMTDFHSPPTGEEVRDRLKRKILSSVRRSLPLKWRRKKHKSELD